MKVLKSSVGIRFTSEEEEAGIDSVSFGVKSYTNE
jgi:ammonia channel protein AmtB